MRREWMIFWRALGFDRAPRRGSAGYCYSKSGVRRLQRVVLWPWRISIFVPPSAADLVAAGNDEASGWPPPLTGRAFRRVRRSMRRARRRQLSRQHHNVRPRVLRPAIEVVGW